MRILLLSIFLTLLANSIPPEISQIKRVEGVFLGQVKEGFSFCAETALGINEVVVFDKILSVILEKYPLNLDKHMGDSFTISYVENVSVRHDGNKETATVIRLQKIMPGQLHRE